MGDLQYVANSLTVWIPGNNSEHFLSRWDLILLGDFFCFINTGRQLWQTIPNKPQRKRDVFIQLCLMTVLLLPAWLSSVHTVPKMELEIPLLTWPQILWIIAFTDSVFKGRNAGLTNWVNSWHSSRLIWLHLHGPDQTACCLWTNVPPLCILPFK